jgi:hypothetical protein
MAKKAKPASKKKNATPELQVDGPLKAQLGQWLDAKKAEKTAKANLKKHETELIDAAAEAREAHCVRVGKYESSFKVTDGEAARVTVKFPNRYSKISTDDEETMREIYEDDYDRYFREKTEVKMTQEAVEDEDFIETVMNAIGEDRFEKYFDVSQHVEPTKAYHEERALNKGLAEKHQVAADAGLVSPTKPSLVAG